jgi:outer membrane protein assembly factor BamB
MDFERSGFSGFDVELEDFEIKKAEKLISRLYSTGPGGSVHCIPKIIDNIVYFDSMDSYVYALDCEKGEVIWKFKTDGQICGNTPEIHDNVLYTGNMAGSIYALDLKTGKMIWRFRASESSTTKVLCHKNRLYLGSLDHNLYCIDTKGGMEIQDRRPGFLRPQCLGGKDIFRFRGF